MRFRWTGLAITLLLASGCDAFRLHPYAVPFEEKHLDRTRKNLVRIARIEPTDTFTFAAIGDSQRWEDEVPGAVASINADPDVRFVLHVGDITEYGLAREYVWVNEMLDELHAPLLTVIGNHDLFGNGGAIYEAVYGPFNYTFIFGRTKFVFFDSNSREYSFDGSVPDIDWVERELIPDATWDRAIVVTHVPPENRDFDRKLTPKYEAALERFANVALSLHGHEHRFRDAVVGDGPVPLVVTNKMASRSWVRITVGPDGVEEVREVPY